MQGRVTKLLLIVALCALGLAVACAPTPASPAPGGPAATPAVSTGPKVLKMARNAEPFSPFVPWQIDDNPALFISVNVYDSLLRTTKDGMGVEPGLAAKWESTSDGLTWTFTLRDNLKYSDGSALKAADVKASLDMARGGEKSAWKDNYKAIKEVQAPDDKTVKVILSQPYAPILSVLAMFCGAVMPADRAKATDTKDYDVAAAWKTQGSGAYYIEGWKKGDPIVLKRNPNYWKGKPAIDEVRIEYIPDDNTRVLKLQGGEVDIIDFVPFSQIAALSAMPNLKAQTFTIQQTAFIILNTEKPPLNDPKVRQALNYATDKDAIIKTVYFGQAEFMNSPIPKGTYWDKTVPGYKYDLDKAKALMAGSAGAKGFTMDMQVRSGNTNFANTAVILKDAWAKIGVTVDIQTQETSVVRANYREGKFMSTPSAWTNDMNDPTQIVNYAMRGGASPFAYWTRYNNPAVNDKITKADLEQDAKKREALYAELQKTYSEDAPLVFIAYLGATAGWQKYVDGFVIDGMSYYRFEDVKLNK
ncbi:MAG: ABC transporter substrate-binding protein [Chloroflexi bacterium]|nr:ABC transporter substrate-binding protein [Chloroflexota bacterium]